MDMLQQLDREDTIPQLLEAISRENFILYGQMIVPVCAPREPAGYVEVLVRYLEEERNLLPPGGFFEVLESLNLMSMLDRWVLNRVVRSMFERNEPQKSWRTPRYSVNLSVDVVYEDAFPGLVREYFKKYKLPPGKLCFEMDESEAHLHVNELFKLTSSVNPVGCGFTITSYTGALMPPDSLRSLHVESVKMDSNALVAASTAGAAQAGPIAVFRECKKQGVQVIAERVEQSASLRQLKALGVDYAQGFAICRPAPLETLHQTLR